MHLAVVYLHVVTNDQDGDVCEEQWQDDQGLLCIVVVVQEGTSKVEDSCNHPGANEEKY